MFRSFGRTFGPSFARCFAACTILAVGVNAGMAGIAAAAPATTVAGTPARTLVVALFAKPLDRGALRTSLAGEQTQRLEAWRRQGTLASYQVLFTRYADAGVWDGLEVLAFRDDAALSRWSEVERASPGGLSAKALAVVEHVVTTPADRIRSGGRTETGAAGVFLVIPYLALVSSPEYIKYLDGYTIPQFDGWIGEHVLDGYDVEYSRYPADRPWLALIILRYHDDAALAQRDRTTATVRARLVNNAVWKAYSDDKKAVRTEKVLAIADQLAGAGQTP